MVQKVNVTLDDVSPLIEYSPREAWIAGQTADPFWDLYDNNGTFTLTTTYGASAALTFNGTAIWIFGAKRGNHGPYSTTLDGSVYADDGYFDGQLFQQVLFSAVNLDGTVPHTVSIANMRTNDSRPYLDVDSIVYQVEFPDDYDNFREFDGDGAFAYSPAGWETVSDPDYYGNVGRATSSDGAYMNYTFEGDSLCWIVPNQPVVDAKVEIGSNLQLYGTIGPSNGPFTVQIDDRSPRVLNSTREKTTAQMVLYQESGLSPGVHTVKVTNAPFSGQTLNIDYAVVFRQPSSTSARPPPVLSKGIIGGLVVGVGSLVIVSLIGLYLWCRRPQGEPTIRPQEVLQAEFSDEGGGGAADSLTRLSPVSVPVPARYPAPSPGSPLLPFASYYSPRYTGTSARQNSCQSEPGPLSNSRLVVHNADHAWISFQFPLGAEDEKRVLETRQRECEFVEGQEQDFGPVSFVPESYYGGMLPPYSQVTRPAVTEKC